METKQLLAQIVSKFGGEYLEKIPVLTGNRSLVVDAGGGKIWVRFDTGLEATVVNSLAPLAPDRHIMIGRLRSSPNVWRVAEVRETYIESSSYLSFPHRGQHEYGGVDQLSIHRKQVISATAFVSDSANFLVRVYGGLFHTPTGWVLAESTDGTPAHPDLDLSASVPTSGAVYVGIEADSTGALSLNVGTPFAAPDLATGADVPVPPAGSRLIAFVLLFETQTQLLDEHISVPGLFASTDFDLADVVYTTDVDWIDLTDGGATTLHTHAGGGGDISGTGVVGQVAEFVTDTKTLQAAKIIGPAVNILTLTNAAAATLGLNITAAKTLTLTATDNFTLTIPATGTTALLATANVFTAAQTILGSGLRLSIKDTGTAYAITEYWGGNGTGKAYIGVNNSTGASLLVAGGLGYATVITSNTAHALQLGTNGRARMTIASDGSIGVGYTTPTLPFEVHANGAGLALISLDTITASYQYFKNSDASVIGLFGVDGTGFSGTAGRFGIATWTNVPIVFFTNQITRGAILGTGLWGIGTITPLARLHVQELTTTTNAIKEVQRIEAVVSTAATGGAAGFGVGQSFYAETATDGTNKQQGRLWSKWIVATNGSETAAVGLDAATNSTLQEFISGQGDAGGVKLALYGGTRVARAAAMTAADAGAINSGDAGTDTVIANMRTRINELAAMLNATTGINVCA